jgi:hypothetical protein
LTKAVDQGRGDNQQENRSLAWRGSSCGLAGDGEADEQRQVLGEFGQEGGKGDGRW